MKRPEDYFSDIGVDYRKSDDDNIGRDVICVLDFLFGRKWDEVALAYVHAMRPSSIMVLRYNESHKLTPKLWRVMVCLNEDGLIENIEQEVEVLLPESIRFGSQLKILLG